MSLKCSVCAQDAPENVQAIGEWVCPNHSTKPLTEAIKGLYSSGEPHTIVYLSMLTPNLIEVHKFFNEQVEHTNPHCTITLSYPEAFPMLQNEYDVIYLDDNVLDADFIVEKLKKPENYKVYKVNHRNLSL